jgi:TetR/AcrR family transcriptional regulator, cholesterol catabolism regulator
MELTSPVRETILLVARDLFFEKGLAATSMRDIANGAGLAQSSLYNHFETKDALVLAVMERSFEVVDSAIRDKFDAPPRLELLRQALTEHALQHVYGIKETMVFEFEGRHMPDRVRERVVELRGIYERRFHELSAKLVDCGCISGNEVRTKMRLILSAGGDIGRWFRVGGRLSEDEVAETFADMGLAGLRAAPCKDHQEAGAGAVYAPGT